MDQLINKIIEIIEISNKSQYVNKYLGFIPSECNKIIIDLIENKTKNICIHHREFKKWIEKYEFKENLNNKIIEAMAIMKEIG